MNGSSIAMDNGMASRKGPGPSLCVRSALKLITLIVKRCETEAAELYAAASGRIFIVSRTSR